jgi:glycerate dehydrogenase
MKKFNKIAFLGYTEDYFKPEFWKELDTLQLIVSKELKDANVIAVKPGTVVDQKLIDQAPNLKLICVTGTGYGAVDTKYAHSKGVKVTNVKGYSTEGVAEFTFALLLEYLRDLATAKKNGSEGDVDPNPFMGTEIKDKNFGVIGLGNIGNRVAEIALGFGATTSYWSRTRRESAEQKGIGYQELDQVVTQSNIISLTLALNSETNSIINSELINKIKPGSILINTSPNELIDQKALKERLAKGDLTYIFDHGDEMSPEELAEISKQPGVIPYPAVGFRTLESQQRQQQIILGNLKGFLNGKPVNVVN